MKIEIDCGEGRRTVKLDGHDVADACVSAAVEVDPDAVRVSLVIAPERLVLLADDARVFVERVAQR